MTVKTTWCSCNKADALSVLIFSSILAPSFLLQKTRLNGLGGNLKYLSSPFFLLCTPPFMSFMQSNMKDNWQTKKNITGKIFLPFEFTRLKTPHKVLNTLGIQTLIKRLNLFSVVSSFSFHSNLLSKQEAFYRKQPKPDIRVICKDQPFLNFVHFLDQCNSK